MIEGKTTQKLDKIPRFNMTDSEFQYISKFAKNNLGISLEESKKSLVNSRVSRRLREIGINNFKEYKKILESKDSSNERTNLLSVLTTNITSFFRERHHFEYLVDHAIPEILKLRSNQDVKIWSAGCSTGQEPYSIALELLRKTSLADNNRLSIIATDIDPKVVEIAKKGEYALSEMREVDQTAYRDSIHVDRDEKKISIGKNIKDVLNFSVLNLNTDFRSQEEYDIIFCRNVTIYFDRSTQQLLWNRFAASLKPNGYLFVGHSERVSGDASAVLAPVATTTYQKSSDGADSEKMRLKARP